MLFPPCVVVARPYYQLRPLRPFIRYMSSESDAVKTLVQAFISCRLDYCNSLFSGISDGLMTGHSTVWPHHAKAGGLQDGHLGLLFVVRHGSSSYLAADCHLSSAAFCRVEVSRTCVVRWTYSNIATDVSRLAAQDCGTAFQLVLGNGHQLWTA